MTDWLILCFNWISVIVLCQIGVHPRGRVIRARIPKDVAKTRGWTMTGPWMDGDDARAVMGNS